MHMQRLQCPCLPVEFLNRKLALLTRHDEPPQPDYATVDVEAHWRDTVYQSQASSPKRWNLGSLDHAVLIAEAVPLHGAAGGLRRTPATYTVSLGGCSPELRVAHANAFPHPNISHWVQCSGQDKTSKAPCRCASNCI